MPANQFIAAGQITGVAPISGGGDLSQNRGLSIPQAGPGTGGYLSSGDWAAFNSAIANSGTVQYISTVFPTGLFSTSGSPVTSSGGFSGGFINQPASSVWLTPLTGSAPPFFGPLTSGYIPIISASQVSGLTGTGTVTSVGLTLPTGLFVTSGSPITTNGAFSGGLINQPPSSVWLTPTGASGTPFFAPLTSGYIPTISAAQVSGLTTGLPSATCYILHADGTSTSYNGTTNSTRGSGFRSAVGAWITSDVIYLSGGTFDLGSSSTLTIPASCVIIGAGPGVTNITGSVNDYVLTYSNTANYSRGFSVTNTNTAGPAPGAVVYSASSGESIWEDCSFDASSGVDGFDGKATGGATAKFINNRFTYLSGIATCYAMAILSGNGTYRFYECEWVGGGATSRGLLNNILGANAFVFGGRVTNFNSSGVGFWANLGAITAVGVEFDSNTTDLKQASTGTLTISYCVYTTTSGTITTADTTPIITSLGNASFSQNKVLVSPTGSTGGFVPRLLVSGDIPTISQNQVSGINFSSIYAAGSPALAIELSLGMNAPSGACLGSDGNVWVCDYTGSKIWRITPGGSGTSFATTTTGAGPRSICWGPDGNGYFTEYLANKIGKITTAGVITETGVPTSNSGPWGICSDGTSLFFTEYLTSKIGKITTSLIFTETGTVTGSAGPMGICCSGTGLFVCENTISKIGRYTTLLASGVEFATTTATARPLNICNGPDSNFYITYNTVGTSKVAQMTPTGSFIEFTATGSQPNGICLGPNANLFFTDTANNSIQQMTPSGSFTSFAVPTTGAIPAGICVGADAALWIPENVANKVLVMDVEFGADRETCGLTRVSRTRVVDSNYTQVLSDAVISYTSITAARTVTLLNPTFGVIFDLLIKDESGSSNSTNTITIALPAGVLCDGSSTAPVINTPYGAILIYTDGLNYFTRNSSPNGAMPLNPTAAVLVKMATANSTITFQPQAGDGTGVFFKINNQAGTTVFSISPGNGGEVSVTNVLSAGGLFAASNTVSQWLSLSAAANGSGQDASIYHAATNVAAIGTGSNSGLATLRTGGLQVNSATKTTTYSALISDNLIIGDPTTGSFTITLPLASTSSGQVIQIIKKVATNVLTVKGNGSDSILVQGLGAANTVTLNSIYDHIILTCDGGVWWATCSSVGLINPTHIVGASTTPGIVAGAAAGSGPTISLTGTDLAGKVNLTTGTVTPGSGTVCTVTYNAAYVNTPYVVFSPAEPNSALLSGTSMVYVSGTSGTFAFNIGTAGLVSATNYVWNYLVLG